MYNLGNDRVLPYKLAKKAKLLAVPPLNIHPFIFSFSILYFLFLVLFYSLSCFASNMGKISVSLCTLTHSDFSAWCTWTTIWCIEPTMPKYLVCYSEVNDNKTFENLRRRWSSKRAVWEKRNIKKGPKQINFSWHVLTYSSVS